MEDLSVLGMLGRLLVSLVVVFGLMALAGRAVRRRGLTGGGTSATTRIEVLARQGLGRTSSNDTDANRNDLFGNAAQRQQQQEPSGYGQQPGGYGSTPGGYGQSTPGSYGGASSGGYGAYGDRELTAEEQEEEDIGATKQEIKFMKQQDVSSTRNALRLAQQAEETGRDTLARLGAQGERIHKCVIQHPLYEYLD